MNNSIFYPGWAVRPEYYQIYAADSCVDYGFFSEAATPCTPIPETTPHARIIYAHSMGCINALKAASAGKAEALVLFSPFISFCTSEHAPGQPNEAVDAMIKQLAISPPRLLKSFYRSAQSPEKFAMESGAELNHARLEEGLHYLKDSNLSQLVSSINIPVLILAGTADLIVPAKSSEYAASLIKSAEFHLIEDAGHMLPLTRPDECKEISNAFLRKAGF